MKITILLLLSFFVFYSPNNHSANSAVSNSPVAFEHPNSGGDYIYPTLCTPKLDKLNDKITSLRIPVDWRLVCFKHPKYCGKSISLGAGYHDLEGTEFNDQISSIDVYYKGKLQGFSYTCPKKSKPKEPRAPAHH